VPTLPAYRRGLSRKIGQYIQIVVGAQVVTPTGTYLGTANGSQAQREVITSDLARQVASGTIP
jgi:hypothetical protein